MTISKIASNLASRIVVTAAGLIVPGYDRSRVPMYTVGEDGKTYHVSEFITPNNDAVKYAVDRALGEFGDEDIIRSIASWVMTHFDYALDSESSESGRDEVWRFPEQTLRYERGARIPAPGKKNGVDCEDVGFLGVSMCGAAGVPPEYVRAAVGSLMQKPGVLEYLPDELIRLLFPRAEGGHVWEEAKWNGFRDQGDPRDFESGEWSTFELTDSHVLEKGRNVWKTDESHGIGYRPQYYVYGDGEIGEPEEDYGGQYTQEPLFVRSDASEAWHQLYKHIQKEIRQLGRDIVDLFWLGC